jgi:hypothetical protein
MYGPSGRRRAWRSACGAGHGRVEEVEGLGAASVAQEPGCSVQAAAAEKPRGPGCMQGCCRRRRRGRRGAGPGQTLGQTPGQTPVKRTAARCRMCMKPGTRKPHVLPLPVEAMATRSRPWEGWRKGRGARVGGALPWACEGPGTARARLPRLGGSRLPRLGGLRQPPKRRLQALTSAQAAAARSKRGLSAVTPAPSAVRPALNPWVHLHGNGPGLGLDESGRLVPGTLKLGSAGGVVQGMEGAV